MSKVDEALATAHAAVAAPDKKTLAARAAVVAALSGVYGAVEKSGSVVTQLCDVADKFYKGAEIPKADVEYVVERTATERKWSAISAKSRKSEARALLNNYSVLPELVKAWREKAGACTWHNATALAREVGKHKGTARVRHAVAALWKRATKPAVDPADLDRKAAKKAAASSLKRIMRMTRLERDFRKGIARLCETYRINLGALAQVS